MTTLEKYRVTGLTCTDCAARIEEAAAALPGVASARVDIATGTIFLEHNDGGADNPRQEQPSREEKQTRQAVLARIVRDIEPSAALALPSREDAARRDRLVRRRTIQLSTAIFLFAVGIVIPPSTVRTFFFGLAYVVAGASVILRAIRGLLTRRPLDENVLMTIATAGAWLLAEAGEAAAVMVFYQLGDTLQALAVNRSRKSVAALLDLRPRTVRRRMEDSGAEEMVDPALIAPGDLVVVLPGERVAVDGVVHEGEGTLDTSALTGESLPRVVQRGESLQAGVVAIDTPLVVRATAAERESTVARMLALVEEAAGRKAPTEQLMTRLARVYTPLVVGVAAMLAIIPPLVGVGSWETWVYRALVFLVVSCPCALVVSIPLGYFAGIGAASRQGILIKGGQFLDALGRVKTVVFDKTGTVTTGTFGVSAVHPVDDSAGSREELLTSAFRATARSGHPVARAVASHVGATHRGDENDVREDQIREIAGRGIVLRRGGETICAGSATHLRDEGVRLPGAGSQQDTVSGPGTVMHVARDGVYLGHFLVEDQLRPGAGAAVASLREQGVEQIVLLSGDRRETTAAVGEQIGAETALGELMPQDKVRELESLLATAWGKTLFVGDGINDSAVIARADVGVAMGGIGSDAAVEAADVVLMRDDPALIPVAIGLARRTQRIVMQNVVFALGTKAVFLLAASLGLATMWMAVFADVGVTVLTVLNTLRVLAIARSRPR